MQLFDTFRPANSRLFAIGKVNGPGFPSGTGELTLRNVHIKGFHIKGGNGGVGGGGGGLGAGGAIYVHEGALTVENSTFENNGAVGGNGDGNAGTAAGGGGGLSGNGGEGCPSSGGGGGGSRGNGGRGGPVFVNCAVGGGGGGGGGTVLPGGDGLLGFQPNGGGPSGIRCGGIGGAAPNDGHNATCGGGGGGPDDTCAAFGFCAGDGGRGGYGGGGGGGSADGGSGGFGGGGGAGFSSFILRGGNGGFGGGGGAAGSSTSCTFCFVRPGKGGRFAGRADADNGGGGGALGGAIFSHDGTVRVQNSTFFNNFVARGNRGGGSAANGGDAGGAIFAVGKSVEITNSTFSGNQATGSGAGVVVHREDAPVSFVLNNNIIAKKGAFECFFTGNVTAKGVGNLIMTNGTGIGPFSPCPGAMVTSDPQLLSLQLNSPGKTPTMAIPSNSPAVDQADASTSLSTDQRGVTRPQGAGFDIGAVEAAFTTTWNPSATNIILSDGNLTFALGSNGYDGVRAVASASSGKKYWELLARTIVSTPADIVQGIATKSFPVVGGNTWLGVNLDGIGWGGDGRVYINGSVVATVQGWQQGDVLSLALDLDNKRIWFRTSAGNWNNNPANDPATNTGGIDISTLAAGPYFPFGQGYSGRDTLTANFGATAYTQSVPGGFANW